MCDCRFIVVIVCAILAAGCETVSNNMGIRRKAKPKIELELSRANFNSRVTELTGKTPIDGTGSIPNIGYPGRNRWSPSKFVCADIAPPFVTFLAPTSGRATLWVGTGDDTFSWFTATKDIHYVTLSGSDNDHLDIKFSKPIIAAGFDFVKPMNDHVHDATYQAGRISKSEFLIVAKKRGLTSKEIGRKRFVCGPADEATGPNYIVADTRSFIGVIGTEPFDMISFVEVVPEGKAKDDDECWGGIVVGFPKSSVNCLELGARNIPAALK